MKVHLSADEVRKFIKEGLEEDLQKKVTAIEIHNRGAATVTIVETNDGWEYDENGLPISRPDEDEAS